MPVDRHIFMQGMEVHNAGERQTFRQVMEVHNTSSRQAYSTFRQLKKSILAVQRSTLGCSYFIKGLDFFGI
jgi:hypothetical protein